MQGVYGTARQRIIGGEKPHYGFLIVKAGVVKDGYGPPQAFNDVAVTKEFGGHCANVALPHPGGQQGTVLDKGMDSRDRDVKPRCHVRQGQPFTDYIFYIAHALKVPTDVGEPHTNSGPARPQWCDIDNNWGGHAIAGHSLPSKFHPCTLQQASSH